MTAAGHDAILAAEEAFNRLGLGRRFDDDQIFGILRQGVHFLQGLLFGNADGADDDGLFAFFFLAAFLFLGIIDDDGPFNRKF